MIKTGEILRKAREEKGFSLNEVALSLKISTKILTAIEAGDESQLPAKTFLRGFVQSYANYLRLDVDKVMATFLEEVGTTRPKPLLKNADANRASGETTSSEGASTEQSNQDHLAPINEKSNTKTIVAVVIGVVLVVLIVFTKKMIDKYTKEAQVDSNVAVSEPIAEPTPAPVSSATPEPNEKMSTAETTPAATPAVPPVISKLTAAANSAAATPAPSPSPTPKASVAPTTATSATSATSAHPAASPSPSPVVAATPVVSATPVASASPTPTPTPSPSPSPSPEKPVAKSVELIIEALDNVEIEYSSNNGKKSTIKLSAEQVHTFKSKNGLKVSISNGGAVNLIMNGRDLGIPGDLGKSINLSY